MKRYLLQDFLSSLFIENPSYYKDFCPNGLQVSGTEEINNIAFSISATKDSIEKAVNEGADALITHHGIVWNFQHGQLITNEYYNRLAPLIKNNINLFSYHLPLDSHLTVGNARVIADLIKVQDTSIKPFGDYKGNPTGVKGEFKPPISEINLRNILEDKLNKDSIISTMKGSNKKIKTIGIITGGASHGWKNAKEEGLDAYITGEISEHDFDGSREAGVHMFACGHNATEYFGILNLMNIVYEKFKVHTIFIGTDNLV